MRLHHKWKNVGVASLGSRRALRCAGPEIPQMSAIAANHFNNYLFRTFPESADMEGRLSEPHVKHLIEPSEFVPPASLP